MVKWLKNNRLEAFLFLFILLTAVFLRFYNLPGYMSFSGDEGRDMLMMKRIWVDFDFPLLGPGTSFGNMYLGPIYYYLMAIPTRIFWLSPVAAAGMVGIFSLGTLILIYYLARVWFGRGAAVTSSVLYAVSAVVVICSRSSWNPYPAPFFSLLVIFGFFKAREKNNYLWLIISGGALACAIQMHYLALLLLPVAVILWFAELVQKKKEKNGKYFYWGTILGIFSFLFLMSPLLIFDLRYNFQNSKSFLALFSANGAGLGFKIMNLLNVFGIYLNKLTGRYIALGNIYLGVLASIISIIPLLLIRFKYYQKKVSFEKIWPYFALSVWLLIGLIGLTFYPFEIYDHYLGFLSPIPFLLIGAFVEIFKGKIKYLVILLILIPLVFVNLSNSILLTKPQNQLERTQQITRYIINEAGGKPFNFALLAAKNYDSAYQFYLDLFGFKPQHLPENKTDQLFVVCEDEICKPVGNPKYEIAAFGMTKIDKESEYLGIKIFKLVSNPSGKP